MMEARPRFLSGIFAFSGTGLSSPAPLGEGLVYTVPSDRRSQLVFFRAGNSSAELVCFSLLRDGAPFRLFPIGAKAALHVPLSVTEDLHPETRVEVFVSAPAGISGEVVVDIGLVEI